MTEITIKAPEEFHKMLEAILPLYHVTTPITHVIEIGDNITCVHNSEQKQFKTPVRLGKILDFIAEATNVEKRPQTIHFEKATLDTHSFVFTTEKNKKISLTEKEADLLIHLHENKGKIISREDLLKTVWNYAEDVETHTLETHIYRLRKKIEKKPSEPAILKTADNGYIVF